MNELNPPRSFEVKCYSSFLDKEHLRKMLYMTIQLQESES